MFWFDVTYVDVKLDSKGQGLLKSACTPLQVSGNSRIPRYNFRLDSGELSLYFKYSAQAPIAYCLTRT